MAGATSVMQRQELTTNNLANVNTTGFKEDMAAFLEWEVKGPVHPTRVTIATDGVGTSLEMGGVEATNRSSDIAINEGGWMAVQAPDGTEAYTRRGDLRVTPEGTLVNGAGHPIIGDGGPITVPFADGMVVAPDGTVKVVQPDGGAVLEVGRIKLIKPDESVLKKRTDGLMGLETGVGTADASVKVRNGFLESSNVDAVGAMVRLIELNKHYDFQLKMMTHAKENSAATDKIMQM